MGRLDENLNDLIFFVSHHHGSAMPLLYHNSLLLVHFHQVLRIHDRTRLIDHTAPMSNILDE
jgi:hypothetical protein